MVAEKPHIARLANGFDLLERMSILIVKHNKLLGIIQRGFFWESRSLRTPSKVDV